MIEIGLIGNPNIGKTTLFNGLTGANQKVGNWPGVTVDKKFGKYRSGDTEITIVDLPGTYSLGAFSGDELVSRDYILQGNPDVIIDVVDATNLERNLYLPIQLLEMNVKLVIALNMMDEAEAQELKFDLDGLSEDLGVKIVPIIASRRKGLDELISACMDAHQSKQLKKKVDYGELNTLIDKLSSYFSSVNTGYPPYWLAVKYIEGDSSLISATRNLNELKANDEFQKLVESILDRREELELEVIDKRYEFIHSVIKKDVEKPITGVMSSSDDIDKIVTNRYLGIPIFALTMLIVFQLTFAIGKNLLGGYIESGLEKLAAIIETWLLGMGTSEFFIGFIVDGLFAGVGTVISFIPLIAILFLLLGFLEDIGYMARVAYVMDIWMRKLGLQGKTIISMIVGFGCNVPGVMSTRTLDNKRDRMIALMINPFMSCGAKVPVYAMFTAAFFPKNSGLVMFGIYVLGFLIAIIAAKVFSKTLFKGESSDFIMELPPYRAPIAINVIKDMWENLASFIKRASTTITLVIAALYILAHMPLGVEPYSVNSTLGSIGNLIKPLLKPMGNDNWQAAVGLVAGMPAKEGVVATLGMIYAGSESSPQLLSSLQTHFTPLSALSYMVMVLLYTPCVAVLGSVKKETKSTMWMLFMAFYTLFVAYAVSVIIYQVGIFLGFV